METAKHFVLDLFDCLRYKLNDKTLVKKFLIGLADELGLKYVKGPDLYQFEGEHLFDNGITGTLVLATSLLDIHTYPRERACYIGLFACSDYDVNKFYDYSRHFFGSKVSYMNSVKRTNNKDLVSTYYSDDSPTSKSR